MNNYAHSHRHTEAGKQTTRDEERMSKVSDPVLELVGLPYGDKWKLFGGGGMKAWRAREKMILKIFSWSAAGLPGEVVFFGGGERLAVCRQGSRILLQSSQVLSE